MTNGPRQAELLARTYGYTRTEWDRLQYDGTRLLRQTARNQATITYTQFCADLAAQPPLTPHGTPVAGLLGQINILEHQAGHPLLSALVVHKTGDLFPGPGFWNLAEDWLGIDTGATEDARTAFWA